MQQNTIVSGGIGGNCESFIATDVVCKCCCTPIEIFDFCSYEKFFSFISPVSDVVVAAAVATALFAAAAATASSGTWWPCCWRGV